MARNASTTSCCGHAMISGFYSVDKKTKEDEIAIALENIAGTTNQSRRWVELILAAHQEVEWGPVVRSFGFQLICVFDNSTGSHCYVYGMVTGTDRNFVDPKEYRCKGVTPLMTENAPITVKSKDKSIIKNPFKMGSFWR